MNDLYRSKVVEIHAWQWLLDNGEEEPPMWIDEALSKWPDIGGILVEPEPYPRLYIATLEDVETVTQGYWIIQGLEGELYPCKDSVFRAKYEPAT